MAEKKEQPTRVCEIAQLPPCAKGQRGVGMERVQHLLARFGYLEEGEDTSEEVDEQTSTGIGKYQAHHALGSHSKVGSGNSSVVLR